MKKRVVCLTLLLGAASIVGYVKRDVVKGIIDLEKPQGDLFARLDDNGSLAYICKNVSKSEDMLLDWVEYNGWEKVDQVGEGFFFINKDQETLLLNREPILGGRYLVWRASRPIDA